MPIHTAPQDRNRRDYTRCDLGRCSQHLLHIRRIDQHWRYTQNHLRSRSRLAATTTLLIATIFRATLIQLSTRGRRIAVIRVSAGFAVFDAALIQFGVAVKWLPSTITILATRSAGLASAFTIDAGLKCRLAFIDSTIAIVVHPVADLACTRINIRVLFIAIYAAKLTHALAITVAIHVHTGPLVLPGRCADAITVSTVIVSLVSADFHTTTIHSRVSIVTVRPEAHGTDSVAILILVLRAALHCRKDQVGVIAVLIDSISGDFAGARIDCWVAIVAVRSQAPGSLSVAVFIIVEGAPWVTWSVPLVAVLIDIVPTDFGCPWVDGSIIVVAVGAVAAGTLTETVQVHVHAVLQTSNITSGAVVIFTIAADFHPAGVHEWVLVVTIAAASGAVCITGNTLKSVTIFIQTRHSASLIKVGWAIVAVVIDCIAAVLGHAWIHLRVVIVTITAFGKTGGVGVAEPILESIVVSIKTARGRILRVVWLVRIRVCPDRWTRVRRHAHVRTSW